MNDPSIHPILPLWKQAESRRLEFKETFPKGDQVAQTVVAFANGAGGKIVFGVRNQPREIIGIPDDELFFLEERISNHIFDRCAPTIIPETYIQAAEGKNLLVVEVFPGSHKPYYLKTRGKHQGTYIRIGSTNKRASQEILEELERQRRNVSFDSLPAYDVAWHELDLTRFLADYSKATGKTLEETQLKNVGLLIRERENSHPSNAAVLLSDSPSRKRWFPFAKIECARFKGTTPNVFLDQATIDLPIHLATEACIAFIKKNIALGSTIGEVYRQDRWEYPLEAIREAVINAIIHRDYSLPGSDIKIAIFDDMLEITSPGPLPDTLSVEDLGTGRSEIRNRVLAPIFKDLGLIEAWGTGMQKIQQAALNDPEIEVIFQEVGYAFQVQFRKKGPGAAPPPEIGQAPDRLRTSCGQAADKLRLLDFCREARSIREMMAFLKLKHRETFLKNYLYPLLRSQLLAMTIPDKPTSPKQRYVITPDGLKKLEPLWKKTDEKPQEDRTGQAIPLE